MSESNPSRQSAGFVQSWMEAQRSLWQAWAGLAANSSAKEASFSDIAEEWQKLSMQSIQSWSSAADPIARSVAEQYVSAQGIALRFLEFTSRAFETVAPKMQSGEDWQKALNDVMEEFRRRWTNMPQDAAAMGRDVESMWKLYMDQWRSFGQPWESVWLRAPSLWGRAVTGDSAALFEMIDVYHGAYKQTLGKLATSPNLGMTREFNARVLEGFDAFTAVTLANAEYQAIVGEVWEKAFKQFGEDMAQLVEKGEKIENIRDLVTFWTRSAENVFLEAFRTERYTLSQGKLLNANMQFRIAQRRVMEEYLEALDMPTRSEVDEAHKRIYELRKEVKALKAQIKEMQDALAAPKKRASRKKKG